MSREGVCVRWLMGIVAALTGVVGAAAQAPPEPQPWTSPTGAARFDCVALPADVQPFTRYLDLGHIPPEDRPALIQVLSDAMLDVPVESPHEE